MYGTLFILLVVISPLAMTYFATNEQNVTMLTARTPENGNWSLTRMKIPANTEGITLKLVSDDVVHSLEIPDLGISVEITPGHPIYIQFPPIEKGLYSYFCHVPCSPLHLDMKGILEAL